jgi:hypothetical protein
MESSFSHTELAVVPTPYIFHAKNEGGSTALIVKCSTGGENVARRRIASSVFDLEFGDVSPHSKFRNN